VYQLARKATVSDTTREQLILAAERLFGEFGIDAVSLRQINAAAGQRNSSAAHYHFGSKDALIAATFDYRMERINGRRLKRLDEISKAGKADDVRTLVKAMIFPLVEEIEESKGGSHYIRFEARTLGHPKLDFFSLWRSEHSDGMGRIYALLKTALPDIPKAILSQRFGIIIELIIHCLGDLELFRMTAEKGKGFNAPLFFNNLVDSCTSVVTAPVSPETQVEIDR
jgi:AcrR family transcriptional regulator